MLSDERAPGDGLVALLKGAGAHEALVRGMNHSRKGEHRALLAEIDVLAQRIRATLDDPDGGVEGVKAQSGEITAFLRKWLVDHVMKADMLLVPLFLRRSDRALKVWIGILLALGAAICAGAAALPAAAPQPADAQHLVVAEPAYLASVGLRLGVWAPSLVSGVATLALPTAFLLGLLASRHRLLEDPARHLPLLRRTARSCTTARTGDVAARATRARRSPTPPPPTTPTLLLVLPLRLN